MIDITNWAFKHRYCYFGVGIAKTFFFESEMWYLAMALRRIRGSEHGIIYIVVTR